MAEACGILAVSEVVVSDKMAEAFERYYRNNSKEGVLCLQKQMNNLSRKPNRIYRA